MTANRQALAFAVFNPPNPIRLAVLHLGRASYSSSPLTADHPFVPIVSDGAVTGQSIDTASSARETTLDGRASTITGEFPGNTERTLRSRGVERSGSFDRA
jgi:hypothetical protein